MAKELTYKKSTTVSLKVAGDFDYEKGTILAEGEEHKLLDLLKDFNGTYIEISAKIKNEEELDVPHSYSE